VYYLSSWLSKVLQNHTKLLDFLNYDLSSFDQKDVYELALQ
jgi:hypothetical protein